MHCFVNTASAPPTKMNLIYFLMGFPDGSLVKNLPANARRDAGLIPGSGRFPGEKNGNPFQFLPGKSHGEWSLGGYSRWVHKRV